MEYPLINSPSSALVYERGFSPSFDIVWSFDYYVDNITLETEVGILIFLQKEEIDFKSGGYGIGLNYTSGLSSSNIVPGMSGAVIGIALDSTGFFATSASFNNTFIRDGIAETDVIPNSIIIRDGETDNSLLTYNVYNEISAFPVIDSDKKTIRARLGNIGRTLYVDYRRSPRDKFVNILTQDVTLFETITGLYRPGVSFTKTITKDVSGSSTIVVNNFHAEGRIDIVEVDKTGTPPTFTPPPPPTFTSSPTPTPTPTPTATPTPTPTCCFDYDIDYLLQNKLNFVKDLIVEECGDYESFELLKPDGSYEMRDACLRWLCRRTDIVDSSPITTSQSYGGPTTNDRDLNTLLFECLGEQTGSPGLAEGEEYGECYLYEFDFFGWYKKNDLETQIYDADWIGSDLVYDLFQIQLPI